MKQIDERILKVLGDRGIQTSQEIEEYFSPSISFLKDAFLLSGMKEATDRINDAISNHESVVIYGDYDADGVSAAAILYMYLKSRGLEANVFIPNRFEDGYGLSTETIEYISETLFPDLVITVDCGITATSEVEMLSDLGIDVIVTDHHIPQDVLPNAIAIVDPKMPSKFGFDGLCGAGVVLKLVQALGGNVLDYIDIAALATIGDIVPLVYENRIIASAGLAKINSASCNTGLQALKDLISPKGVWTAQDVSYKLVPRINSTGRMKDSMLSFRLLVETDKHEAEKIAQQIEQINKERMSVISTSIQVILNELKQQDLSSKSAIIVCSKDFHQGVLGILASRLVGEYQRPAFVFHESADGSIKGSCRSYGDFDIHEILMKLSFLCENIGGHKYAAGLSISKENFDEFCQKLEELVSKSFVFSAKTMPKFDIELEENELTVDFAKQVELLEPTGYGNEPLVFCMKTNGATYKQTSNPKHYQLITKSKKYLLCFGGQKYQNLILQKGTKVTFDVHLDKYNNEYRVKSVVKDVFQPQIAKMPENTVLCAIADCFDEDEKSQPICFMKSKDELLELAKKLSTKSGVLVVAHSFDDANLAKERLGLEVCLSIPENQMSCIVYAPNGLFDKENLVRYQNVILLSGTMAQKGFCTGVKFFGFEFVSQNILAERKIFADCFRVFEAQNLPAKNNVFEYTSEIKRFLPYSAEQIAFVIAVFAQLGLVQTKDANDNFVVVVQKDKKRKLEESKLYQKVSNRGEN